MSFSSTYQRNGLDFVILENDRMKTEWLPEIGGKMVSLVDKSSGAQLIGHSYQHYSNTNLPYYGAAYDTYGGSGFDECFPTIEASDYPLPESLSTSRLIHFPDHGEVWSLPWTVYTQADTLIMQIAGVRKSYVLQKQIQLYQNTIRMEYTLTNNENTFLQYLWASNMLLNLTEHDTITLHSKPKLVLIGQIDDPQIGQPGDTVVWPAIFKKSNFSRPQLSMRDLRFPMRIYSEALDKVGYRISYFQNDVELSVQFETEVTPYLGIEVYDNQKVQNDSKSLTLSLQASTGRPGSLAKAIQRGETGEIQKHEIQSWAVQMSVV